MSRDLKDALRQGGTQVSTGRVRIDAGRALERLQKFRFAEPEHWVLEVLRAAVASGAEKVSVRTDADDVEVRFGGRPFPAELMKELLEQALNAGVTPDERRAKLLSLGVAGALGVAPRFVRVVSGGVQLELEPPGVVRVTAVSQQSTFVHVRKRLGWKVAASVLAGAGEARAIKTRATRYPVELRLNDARIDRPLQSAQRFTQHREEALATGGTLVVGVCRDADLPAMLELDLLGVTVAQRAVVLPGLVPMQGVLKSDDLRRNVSGSDVIDSDAQLREALACFRRVSLETLAAEAKRLGAEDDEGLRRRFQSALLDRALDSEVRAILREAPLLPGPSGEWLSIAALDAEVREGRPVRIARRTYPRGSYTRPAVLLPSGSPLDRFVPAQRRVDVADEVARRERAARNKESWERMPHEPALVGARSFIARAKVASPFVAGEVGLLAPGPGSVAEVRVLYRGGFLQQGELPSLAPLALAATVDLSRELPEEVWQRLPSDTVMTLVAAEVERAAVQAAQSVLGTPDGAVQALLLAVRAVRTGAKSIGALPSYLREVPLFETLGGEPVSLDVLAKRKPWRFTALREPRPLLSGAPVLVLGTYEKEVLEAVGSERLVDVWEQLRSEAGIRRRLEGPKLRPEVADALVSVPIEAPGLVGVVALPRLLGKRLELTLLRDGFLLERTELSARYGLAVASVECGALSPNESWDGAVRDAAYDAVKAAVAGGERHLAARLAEWAVAAAGQRGASSLVEWALPEPPAGAALGALPRSGRKYLFSFVEKELVPFEPARFDEVQLAVAKAPWLQGLRGPLSLLDVHAAAGPERRVWVTQRSIEGETPPGLVVVHDRDGAGELLSEVLGLTLEDAHAELERLAAARRFEALPVADVALPAELPLPVDVEGPPKARGALAAGVDTTTTVKLFAKGRALGAREVHSRLPLRVHLELDDLTPHELATLKGDVPGLAEAVRAVEERLLEAALEDPSSAPSRRALLCAVGTPVTEKGFPKALTSKLMSVPLFPCADGTVRPANQLKEPVPTVTEPLSGPGTARRPVVVLSPEVTRGLARWATEDVTRSVKQELEVERAREAQPQVEAVVVSGDVLVRRPLEGAGLTGEVAVMKSGGGQLALFLHRRPLCVLDDVLQAPLSGAVDSAALTPLGNYTQVMRDTAFDELVRATKRAALELAAELSSADLAGSGSLEVTALLARLALTVLGQRPRKKRRLTTSLERLPLLVATDGRTLSVADLLAAQAKDKAVPYSHLRGSALAPARWIWSPREGEQLQVEKAGLFLVDAADELARAAEVRARPRVSDLRAPSKGTFREGVVGAGLSGEVALEALPLEELVVEVVHEGVLLERWTGKHAAGATARVESSAISPNATHTGAMRNQAFKEMLGAVEAALERLLLRRLAGEDARTSKAEPMGEPEDASRPAPDQPGPRAPRASRRGAGQPPSRGPLRDEAWLAWAVAAVRFKAGSSGALAELVPSLALFEALDGAAVSVGEVLAEAQARRRVAVALKGTPLPEGGGGLVLADSPTGAAVLEALGLEVEDVTGDLQRSAGLRQSRLARRLSTLSWTGEVVVRVPVASPELRGELVLVRDAGDATVTLARDGIAVCPLEGLVPPGVAGVLDIDELPVDEGWTTATLTPALRATLRDLLELPWKRLVESAAGLDDDARVLAAGHVLGYLAFSGAKAAAHLDRLTGVAATLLDLNLFPCVDGRFVSVRAVAAEVLLRGKVPVTPRRVFRADVGGRLVLEAASLRAPWVRALEGVVGERGVQRVKDLAEWKAALAEEDPPEGTPEARGLSTLRKEVRLLRSGALGRLTTDELAEVKVRRGNGKTPIRYDEAFATVWLDPTAPSIARALAESRSRPERIWALVVAIFGAVNRALERVTDEHEAQLLLALAAHLAANPKALEPSVQSGEGGETPS